MLLHQLNLSSLSPDLSNTIKQAYYLMHEKGQYETALQNVTSFRDSTSF